MSNSSPVLSYKKPSTRSLSPSSNPSSPIIGSSPQLDSIEGGTRKVLSRRKALQDFYKLQQKTSEATQKIETKDAEVNQDLDITNSQELDKWIKSKSIVEILKLRNSINNDLNSQDLENKSIIYNNYYELIKLNKILDDLLRPKVTETSTPPDGLGIFVDNSKETNDNNEDYVESKLNELADFVNEKSKIFNNDFGSVVKTLLEEKSDNASISSTAGVIEKTIPDISDKIDKEELVKEIDFLLQNKHVNSDSKVYEDVKGMIEILDPTDDEVLIEQLNALIINTN